jgi:hypothetical protein
MHTHPLHEVLHHLGRKHYLARPIDDLINGDGLDHLILRQKHQVIAVEQPAIDKATQNGDISRTGSDKATGKRSLEQMHEPETSPHRHAPSGPIRAETASITLQSLRSLNQNR